MGDALWYCGALRGMPSSMLAAHVATTCVPLPEETQCFRTLLVKQLAEQSKEEHHDEDVLHKEPHRLPGYVAGRSEQEQRG